MSPLFGGSNRSAGLAVGLALQGIHCPTSPGGVLIYDLKPTKIGDLIEAQGVLACVTGKLRNFSPKMITPQNKLPFCPHVLWLNGNIINYTAEGQN